MRLCKFKIKVILKINKIIARTINFDTNLEKQINICNRFRGNVPEISK
jgi:hypothetical protein